MLLTTFNIYKRVIDLGKKARKYCNKKIHVAVAVSNGGKHVQTLYLFVILITIALLYKKLAAIENMQRGQPCSKV